MNVYDKKIRTIKFRGKTPQGKWVYGYYLIREEESPVIETSVPYTIHYIIDYADFKGLNENEILPETLGQFSGGQLKDWSLERDNGQLYWNVEIYHNGKSMEVTIDATSKQIVKIDD